MRSTSTSYRNHLKGSPLSALAATPETPGDARADASGILHATRCHH
jgi:hypothetical protein